MSTQMWKSLQKPVIIEGIPEQKRDEKGASYVVTVYIRKFRQREVPLPV